MTPRPSDHPTTVEREEWRDRLAHNYRLAQHIKRYPESVPGWLADMAYDIPRQHSLRADLVVYAICLAGLLAMAAWRVHHG